MRIQNLFIFAKCFVIPTFSHATPNTFTTHSVRHYGPAHSMRLHKHLWEEKLDSVSGIWHSEKAEAKGSEFKVICGYLATSKPAWGP